MKYIIVAIAFISCNGIKFREAPPVSTEVLDTIKSVPEPTNAHPALFEKAFVAGTSQTVNNVTSTFYGVNIGKLKVPSGRLTACDPMHIDEYGIPYTQQFPTGEFPVQLAIAKFNDGERIAFARIIFSDEPVARWQFALQKGQTPIPVEGKEMHGFSTDTGTGIYIDEEAGKALDRKEVASMDTGIYRQMDKHYRDSWRYAMVEFGNHNLAAFSTGLGDGFYGTYIGFDAQGRPCRLLTDFGLYEWRKK